MCEPDWFIYAFVRKEAVLSSQIEGTQATLVDLLVFEAQKGTADSLGELLGAFEKYLRADDRLPAVLRARLDHHSVPASRRAARK